eukprot:10198540-Alexandrium_andersonii.AAC.1
MLGPPGVLPPPDHSQKKAPGARASEAPFRGSGGRREPLREAAQETTSSLGSPSWATLKPVGKSEVSEKEGAPMGRAGSCSKQV